MTIRAFNPSIVGDSTLASEMKNSSEYRCMVEYLAKQLHRNPSNTRLLHSIYTAHFLVGVEQLPCQPNITLGTLTSLIDEGAVQEYMSGTRLKELMFGKNGLFVLNKLLMPIVISKDIEGNPICAGGRHRSTMLGFIAYSTALQLKHLGMPVDEAVALLDSQELYVDYLGYDCSTTINPVFTVEKKAGKSVTELDITSQYEELNFLVKSQLVIQLNSSRKPQAGEIESVELSSVGVNPRKSTSVHAGFVRGALDKFKLFRYLSSAELYNGGYGLILRTNLRPATFNSYYPATMRKLFDAVSKTLWAFESGAEDGNFVFRSMLTGCENALPKFDQGKKAWKTPAPKPASSSYIKCTAFVQAFWEGRTLEDWESEIADYDFSPLRKLIAANQAKVVARGEEWVEPEFSLPELAFQLYHTSVVGNEEVNLDKALTRSKDKMTMLTVLDGLLAAWDASLLADQSSFLDYFGVFDAEEEEEDDIDNVNVDVDEAEAEEEDWLSSDLFGAL